MRTGIPAYFDPRWSPADWAALGGLAPDSIVIVNPDSGPAADMADVYGDAVRTLRRSGVMVYGYVDTAYGAVAPDRLSASAGAYRRRLCVDGIFFDQAPPTGAPLDRIALVASGLRAAGVRVAINPGQPQFDRSAFGCFDEVVAFEGDVHAYRAARTALAAAPSTRAWHLVYGAPVAETEAVLAQARDLGAGVVYVTELGLPNPWRAVSACWSTLLAVTGAPGAHARAAAPSADGG
jgi:hypothetical protein